MTNTALDDLSRLILSQQDGLVKDSVQMRTIISALEQAWPFISGSDRESATAKKLYRAESVSVKKPCVNFTLERHGGAVNGSSRAHLHHWEINLILMTASIVRIGHRQLVAMSPKTPIQALKTWQEKKPELFLVEVNDQSGLYGDWISVARCFGFCASALLSSCLDLRHMP